MAAYNANVRAIQLQLYRYSARLNGLTTPGDNFEAWAKPLDTGLLKRLHDKVILLRWFVQSLHHSYMPPVDAFACCARPHLTDPVLLSGQQQV